MKTVFADLLHKPALDISRAELQLTADGWKLVNRHADNLVSITETDSVIDQ